jgi:hypothetical protein
MHMLLWSVTIVGATGRGPGSAPNRSLSPGRGYLGGGVMARVAEMLRYPQSSRVPWELDCGVG